jgi:hypothetical protein
MKFLFLISCAEIAEIIMNYIKRYTTCSIILVLCPHIDLKLLVRWWIYEGIRNLAGADIHPSIQSSKWTFIKMDIHQSGHSSKWTFIKVDIHQSGHSSKRTFIYSKETRLLIWLIKWLKIDSFSQYTNIWGEQSSTVNKIV